jgi:hypothetical protein
LHSVSFMHIFSGIEVPNGFPAMDATISCCFRTHSPLSPFFPDRFTAFLAGRRKVSK